MNPCVPGGQSIAAQKPKSKKKKAPKNAFSFYLDDVVIELRRSGKSVANKSEAVPLVNDKWKNMTKEEKAPYEQKAKEWKLMNRQQPRSGRLDCTGLPIDSRINMEEENDLRRKEAHKVMRRQWHSKEDVTHVPFYFISFQSLFELPDEEGYQPVEVAILEFTLNDGIVRAWHCFIDPGPIKVGLRAVVKIFREKTHQIPEENFEQASNDYREIWNTLLEFVNPNRKAGMFPPLYTKMSELRKTSFCLSWLSAQAGVANQLVTVYEIEDLTSELYVYAGYMRPSYGLIEDRCNSHMYDYEPNTSCDYHDELECTFCSLLIIKKCCFSIGDTLSELYDYKITDQHVPVRSTPTYRIVQPKFVELKGKQKKDQDSWHLNPLSSKASSNMEVRISEDESDSNSSTFRSRDIRYRPQFSITKSQDSVLRRPQPEPSEDDSSSVSSDSTLLNVEIGPIIPSIVAGSNMQPKTAISRRPMGIPTYAQKAGRTLAANFQNKRKPEKIGGLAAGGDLNDLTTTFQDKVSVDEPYSSVQLTSSRQRFSSNTTGIARGCTPAGSTVLPGERDSSTEVRGSVAIGRGRGCGSYLNFLNP
ncbi:protein maelstrom homolog isoform X2 [Clavelina lepadiformis]|uniref:protein maelstrom homolog isoform X2 n=1 Tax=Clavelina lepadiformis TaxID=159417 RepID=UPI004041F846